MPTTRIDHCSAPLGSVWGGWDEHADVLSSTALILPAGGMRRNGREVVAWLLLYCCSLEVR